MHTKVVFWLCYNWIIPKLVLKRVDINSSPIFTNQRIFGCYIDLLVLILVGGCGSIALLLAPEGGLLVLLLSTCKGPEGAHIVVDMHV